jgi:hypothetical protein
VVKRPAFISQQVLPTRELYLTPSTVSTPEESDHVREEFTPACAINSNKLKSARVRASLDAILQPGPKAVILKTATVITD